MADFAKTISNSINLFASPADKWGDWNWNAFLWGAGTAAAVVGGVNVDALLAHDSTPERRTA